MVTGSPDRGLPTPRFHVFYSSNPVMAASLGRHVILSSGVLSLPTDQVSSPSTSKAQLAFVVAHEMAHHHLDHHAEGISLILVPPLSSSSPQLETCCVLAAAALALRGAILWRLVGVSTSCRRLPIIFLGLRYLVALPCRRAGEHEADQLAMELLAGAGYSPSRAMAFWARAAARHPGTPSLLLSHPAPAEREERLRAWVAEYSQ